MRKIIFALVGMVFIGGAIGADVVERTSCADMKSRIDSLAAQEDLDDYDAASLTDLRALYRTKCTARAGGRGGRAIATIRGAVATVTDEATPADVRDADAPVIAEKCTNPDSNGCCPGEEFEDMGNGEKYCCKDDMCFPPMDVAPAAPQKSEAEIAAAIAANIEKGLCGDGSRPNKYGCCPGEIFKDMGNLGFNCCPKDGGDCFPPIN